VFINSGSSTVNKFIKQKSGLLFIAIFQVVCFFQVTSFIHLHHTHNADGLQITLSFHPGYCHTPNHNNYHHDDNNHTRDNHHELDLTFVKSRLGKVHTVSAEFSFLSNVVTLNKPEFSSDTPIIYCYVASKKIFSSSIFSRSPPYPFC